MTPENENSWGVWSKHVILELERLNNKGESRDSLLTDIQSKLSRGEAEFVSRKECNESIMNINKAIGGVLQELASIKTELSVRSGSWGALMGIIGAILVLILKKAMGW